jgi:hypothetical protein
MDVVVSDVWADDTYTAAGPEHHCGAECESAVEKAQGCAEYQKYDKVFLA